MPDPRQSTQLSRLGRMLLALAVCASLGLHWAALQTVAWTQMLVTYSQGAALGDAVKKTFDGEHPCDLCLLVKQGRSEEKKQEAASLLKKLDAVLACPPVILVRAVRTMEFPDSQTHAEAWQVRSPIPPPRA